MNARIDAAANALMQATTSGACRLGVVCGRCDCLYGSSEAGRRERDRFFRQHASAILRAADEADPAVVEVRRSEIRAAAPPVEVGDDVHNVAFDGYWGNESSLRAAVDDLRAELVAVLVRLRMLDDSQGRR